MSATRLRTRAGSAALAVVGLAAAATLVAGPASAADPGAPGPVTFGATGSARFVTVPDGIQAVLVTATGGSGGTVERLAGYPAAPAPGRGAVVTGTALVVPGQQLTVSVGGQGTTGTGPRQLLDTDVLGATVPTVVEGSATSATHDDGTGRGAAADADSGTGGATSASGAVVSGAPTTHLASTGSVDVGWLAALGVALLVVGASALMLTGRGAMR